MQIDNILINCESGCDEAWNQLFEKYNPYIYSICLRVLRNVVDAEDAAQNAWILIFRHLSQFRHDSHFTTWIYRIAENSAKMLRKKTGPISEEIETVCVETPETRLLRQEIITTLRDSIEQLPHRHRVVLRRRAQDQSYRDIADELGIPEVTTRVRAYFGRKMLRDKLSELTQKQIASF